MSNKIKQIREFVANWTLNYPIDRWWREKHNIPFGSTEHKTSSLIYQRIEFEEDVLFKKTLEASKKESLRENEKEYQIGDWLKVHELTDEEIDRAFDDLII